MSVYDPFPRLNPTTLATNVREYSQVPLGRILDNCVRIFQVRQAAAIARITAETGGGYGDPGAVALTAIENANCVPGGTTTPTDLMFFARAAKAGEFTEGLEVEDTRIRIDAFVVIPTTLIADSRYSLEAWYQHLVYLVFTGIYPVQLGWRAQFTGETDDHYRQFLRSVPDTMSFRTVRSDLGGRYREEYPRCAVAGVACEIKGYELIIN